MKQGSFMSNANEPKGTHPRWYVEADTSDERLMLIRRLRAALCHRIEQLGDSTAEEGSVMVSPKGEATVVSMDETAVPIPGLRNLPQKVQAAVLLSMGFPIGGVASEVGVSRQTLWKWARKDSEFIRYRRAAEKEMKDQLKSRAVATLARAMDDDNANVRLKAAMAVFQKMEL